MRASLRRLLVPFFAPVAIVALVTCTEPTVATGPVSAGGKATLSIVPAFSNAASQAMAMYRAANLDIDRVRVVIVRPPADTLKDTTVTYVAAQGDVSLDLTIKAVPGEQLTVGLEYRAGAVVLFAGSGRVTARALNAPPGALPASPIVVIPVGPGATAASIVVTPSSGSFPTNSPVTFGA